MRQLTGVRFVSLHTTGATTVVEAGADEGTPPGRLRSEARRVTLGHIDGPVVIDVVSDDPPGAAGPRPDRRVRLLLTGSPSGGAGPVVHLAYQERQVTVEAETEDRTTVAAGVLDGLRRLGFGVRFEVVAARGLTDDVGSGTIVVLGDPVTGARRRGVAGGADSPASPSRRPGPSSTPSTGSCSRRWRSARRPEAGGLGLPAGAVTSWGRRERQRPHPALPARVRGRLRRRRRVVPVAVRASARALATCR